MTWLQAFTGRSLAESSNRARRFLRRASGLFATKRRDRAPAAPPLFEAEFDRAWYLRVNPDVHAAGMDPWEHFVTYGHKEGRAGAPLRAREIDHILWRGYAREAEAELRLLLRGDNPRERAAAGWVLARHAACRGKWRNARSAIRKFCDAPEAARTIAHPGPWLLAIQAEARLGDLGAARRLLCQARDRFPLDRNLSLAEMEIVLAADGGDQRVAECLAALHSGSGLAAIDLSFPAEKRFDRLGACKAPPAVSEGPRVSVIVPTHDAEETLGTCLRSLAAQTWRNLEIIVVDDCSADRTAQVATAEALRDPRIRLIRHQSNGGAYVARNTGLCAATGAFVTVHDADDWSHPQKIERQVRALLDRAALCATLSHMVRADDDLRMSLWRIEEGWIYRNTSSLMFRAELREKLGYWDRVRIGADTEFYHRLRAAFGAGAIAEIDPGLPLSFARTGARSLTLQGATHLSSQFAGVRRRYLDAAIDWQRRRLASQSMLSGPEARARALHMPLAPRCRPFPAPPDASPADPCVPGGEYGRVATSPRFDALWYLRRNPDVRAADADPVRHFLDHGSNEDRDPGPVFPNAAWRRLARLGPDAVPLLELDPQLPEHAAIAAFPGALQSQGRPTILVFAHSAERQLFGAERSLLKSLERLAGGFGGQALAPVVVLPSAVNGDYLEQVRARALAVEVLPQVWRHRFRAVPGATISAIRDMIRRHRPVEVHVNTLVLDAPLVAARQEGCPTVVHVRELPHQDPELCRILGDTPHGLRRRLLREADRFVANSRAVADWLDCPDRTAIWPNAVAAALFDLPFAPGDALRVALVSSNLAKKGIADFIEVAQRVARTEAAERVPAARRCRFLLIGPPSSDLTALGRLPANVDHAGYAPDPVAAMRQCDIVLILSHVAESFGRTALEAMAAGRPVVCYDRGTPPSFVDHGMTGVIVPADDRRAVAEAIMTLSRNRTNLIARSPERRAAARRWVEDVPHLGAAARSA